MELFEGMGMIVPIVGIIAVLVLVAGIAVSRYKIAAPDEAIVVTGSNKKEPGEDLPGVQKVVQGGGVFVMPFVQQAHSISLRSRQITMRIEAISSNNITINLEAVALVKVGGSAADVRAAAQRFLSQENEIEQFTQEVLSGSLRSIVGRMTVDQIIRDRAGFANEVTQEAETSLSNQGLHLDTFQIQGISDNSEYLRNLGRPEEADAKRRAAVAEAEAQREAEKSRIEAEEYVLNTQRELDLRRASIQEETDAAKARAEAAGPLAHAEQSQRIARENQKLAEEESVLAERRLVATVNKPADAELYRVRQEAEAARAQRVARAQADAESERLAGQADLDRRNFAAEAAKAEGAAQAEVVRLAGDAEYQRRSAGAKALAEEGAAEAQAIREKGLAEAEAMDKKAEAYEQYGQAAIADLLISRMPEIVREASSPMSNIKDLTVLSTDGASSVAKTGLNNVASVLESSKSLLGFDLREVLGGFVNFDNDDNEGGEYSVLNTSEEEPTD